MYEEMAKLVALDNGIERRIPASNKQISQPYRSEYRRDYERVLHSPAFRRLEGKTQLFPGYESDFFRNRLTHSLEVAQIAKGIAEKLKFENPTADFIESDVCETAGLLHDIGHPPFGHNGEFALDNCMKRYGGFEGNAQSLHIVARLEKKEINNGVPIFEGKKDNRNGLNLTKRTLAAILKYDHEIYEDRGATDPLRKGYYSTDADVVRSFKEALVGNGNYNNFRTIECDIMDIADDIAYSTYDLEDAFKAGFLTPLSVVSASDKVYIEIAKRINPTLTGEELFYEADNCRWEMIRLFSFIWFNDKGVTEPNMELSEVSNEFAASNIEVDALSNPAFITLSAYYKSQELANDGYMRTEFTSKLVSSFIQGITLEINEKYPVLSKIKVDEEVLKRINILKNVTYISLINSPRLKVVENRGVEIVTQIFDRLNDKDGYKFLPEDFQELYLLTENEIMQKRVICDFIAGMTDRYAIEFYGRLYSANPQTIFKPL